MRFFQQIREIVTSDTSVAMLSLLFTAGVVVLDYASETDNSMTGKDNYNNLVVVRQLCGVSAGFTYWLEANAENESGCAKTMAAIIAVFSAMGGVGGYLEGNRLLPAISSVMAPTIFGAAFPQTMKNIAKVLFEETMDAQYHLQG